MDIIKQGMLASSIARAISALSLGMLLASKLWGELVVEFIAGLMAVFKEMYQFSNMGVLCNCSGAGVCYLAADY